MKKARTIPLSSKLMRSLAAVFIWMALVTGVFGLLTRSYFSGVAWTVLGLILLGVVLEGSILRRLENRELPIASFVLVLLVIILIGLSELVNLLVTKPALTASYIFDVLYSLGFLILGGYSAIRVLNQTR